MAIGAGMHAFKNYAALWLVDAAQPPLDQLNRVRSQGLNDTFFCF